MDSIKSNNKDNSNLISKCSLDYYLRNIISKKTNFEVDEIELIITEKTRMNKCNEFNSFIFNYKDKTYKLLDDKLYEI